MYKEDLALNNLQLLICHKTQPNKIKPNQTITPRSTLAIPVWVSFMNKIELFTMLEMICIE